MASHSSILAWRMDRGAWQAIVQRMTKSRAQLKQLSMYFAIDGFPGSSAGKESAYNAGDPSSIPGSGRFTGGRHGNPLQYSCLENSMDGGVWRLQSTGSKRVGQDKATGTNMIKSSDWDISKSVWPLTLIFKLWEVQV